MVALLAKPVGFTPEIGRLLSALLFIPSCVMAWCFVRRRYGDECALVASFLHAFGFPLLVWAEHAFMNESLLICLSLAALLATQRYLEFRRGKDLAVLVITSAIIGAVKLPYLIVWAPVLGLFLLFCMDRKGWVLRVEDEGTLQATWEAGAKMVVVPKAALSEGSRRFLADHGTTVLSTIDTDLVRLP
jgi:4-amino-4-deoxy-L-arabinose transferase-like glycosyltransferase